MNALRNSVVIGLAIFAGSVLLVSTTGCLDELTGPKNKISARGQNVDAHQLMFKIDEVADVDDGHGNLNTHVVQADVVQKTQLDAMGRLRDHLYFWLKPTHRYWLTLWFINGDRIGTFEFRPDALQNASYEGSSDDTVIEMSTWGINVQEKPGAPKKPLTRVPEKVVLKAGGVS